MHSEQLQLLAAGYVLGDLSPEEMEEFEQLLANNSVLADEVAQMQTALEIAYAPPEVSPPSHLRSKLLEANTHLTNSSLLLRSGKKRHRSFSWRWAMELVAAVLIVGLGTSNYYLWRTLQAVQTEVPSAPLTYSLRAKDAGSTTSATVAVNPNALKAVLTVKNLPALPPGKVYVLWTVLERNAPFTTDSKNAILTQVFKVDSDGSASQTIILPKVYLSKELVSAVAVTVEDAVSPQRHEGTPILKTNL